MICTTKCVAWLNRILIQPKKLVVANKLDVIYAGTSKETMFVPPVLRLIAFPDSTKTSYLSLLVGDL